MPRWSALFCCGGGAPPTAPLPGNRSGSSTAASSGKSQATERAQPSPHLLSTQGTSHTWLHERPATEQHPIQSPAATPARCVPAPRPHVSRDARRPLTIDAAAALQMQRSAHTPPHLAAPSQPSTAHSATPVSASGTTPAHATTGRSAPSDWALSSRTHVTSSDRPALGFHTSASGAAPRTAESLPSADRAAGGYGVGVAATRTAASLRRSSHDNVAQLGAIDSTPPVLQRSSSAGPLDAMAYLVDSRSHISGAPCAWRFCMQFVERLWRLAYFTDATFLS